MGNQLLWSLSRKGDEAVVGRSLGSAALGGYSVANRLVTMIGEMLISSIQIVAVPAMSLVQGDKQRLAKGLEEGTVLSAAIACPAFVGLMMLAPELVPLLFGAHWVIAVPVVQVLCIAGILRSFCAMHHPALLAIGRPLAYFACFALTCGPDGRVKCGCGENGKSRVGCAFAGRCYWFHWNCELRRAIQIHSFFDQSIASGRGRGRHRVRRDVRSGIPSHCRSADQRLVHCRDRGKRCGFGCDNVRRHRLVQSLDDPRPCSLRLAESPGRAGAIQRTVEAPEIPVRTVT